MRKEKHNQDEIINQSEPNRKGETEEDCRLTNEYTNNEHEIAKDREDQNIQYTRRPQRNRKANRETAQ